MIKVIVIDDNHHFVNKLCNKFSLLPNDSNLLKSTIDFERLKEKADIIKELVCDETIIFININFKTGNNSRHLQKGIELLTWLRIKGVMNHCVLYSFEPIHSLLKREPCNLIATSKGTSFVQLPNLCILDLAKLSVDKAEKKNIKEILKQTIKIEPLRHQYANWWGIKQLYDVHYALFPEKCIGFEYDESFKKQTSKIDYMVAVYINNFSIDVILKQVEIIKIDEYRSNIEKINNQIKDLRRQLGEPTSVYDPRKENTSLLNKISNKENYLNIHGKYDEMTLKKDKERVSYLESEILKKENSITELIHKRESLISLPKDASSSSTLNCLEQIDKNINSIVYIDDNANNGWKQIFSLILFNNNSSKIWNLTYDVYNSENLTEAAIELVKQKLPDVIMLDLRLQKKDDLNRDINQFASVKILKKVKSDFPGIPVLIVSASNKLISYEKTIINLEADGFWIKEGLDSIPNVNITANNYFALIKHFIRFTSDEYKLSRKIQDTIKDIEEQECPWWINKKWPNNDITKIKKEEVLESLKEIHLLYRIYLNHDWDNMAQLKNIIISATVLLIEKIHQFEHNPTDSFARKAGGTWVGGKISTNRGDFLAVLMYQFRNNIAHANHSDFGFEHFSIFLKAILNWLTLDIVINPDNYLEIIRGKRNFEKIKHSIPEVSKIINSVYMQIINRDEKDMYNC
jgi:CheY-like chemotaxis protein